LIVAVPPSEGCQEPVFLLLVPIVAALVYVLRQRRGEPEDDTDLL
jgi:hypothetical protein